jgi:hypothetical protein
LWQHDLIGGGVTPKYNYNYDDNYNYDGLSKSRSGCEADNNLLCDKACVALATKEPETQERQTRICCEEPGQACVPGQMIESVDPVTGLVIQTPCVLESIEGIS